MNAITRAPGWLLMVVLPMALACNADIPVSEAEAEAGPLSGFLVLGPDRIYYEVSGKGFPLVLVSGGSGMDLRQWDPVFEALRREYRVVRYDPRGIGRSDNPTARYSDSADLEQLLEHLDIDRAGVLGLSSAGGLVLEFALLHPERVAGAVAVAPFVAGFEFSESMLERLTRFSEAASQGREPFVKAMFDDGYFFPAPLDRSVRTAAQANMGENFDKGAGFDAELPIPLDPPLIERLAEIQPNMLLLAGVLDHDDVHRRNRFLIETIPSATERVIPDAGHNVPLENTAGFLQAISDFLRETSQP